MPLNRFLDWIVQRVGNKQMSVYLAGHSYGGWLALRTALQLNQKKSETVRVRTLATLDPISIEDCTVRKFTNAYWKKIIFRGKPAPECTRFPTDLIPMIPTQPQVGAWINFFQTQSAYLHSGEAPGAKNIALRINGFPDRTGSIDPHLLVDDLKEVWDLVMQASE